MPPSLMAGIGYFVGSVVTMIWTYFHFDSHLGGTKICHRCEKVWPGSGGSAKVKAGAKG